MSGAVLGVDLGSARIGVAICERIDLPAMPLSTIQATSRKTDAAALVALARERGADTIVVGYPLRLDGSVGPAARSVDKFVEVLRAVFDGAVVAVDERLTSAAAASKLEASELSGGKRRRIIDRLAAVEILESYRARAARETSS